MRCFDCPQSSFGIEVIELCFDSFEPFFRRHPAQPGQMDAPRLACDFASALLAHAAVVSYFVLCFAARFAVDVSDEGHTPNHAPQRTPPAAPLFQLLTLPGGVAELWPLGLQ